MAQRSPILGYNHNISYRGLVFHVQTEDSGVANPHIFTHLFHGGVILSTRRLDYDAEASDDAVKSLMQAQHKAVLKELKRAEFDEKIDSYLGQHPDLQPSVSETATTMEFPPVKSAKKSSESAPVSSTPASGSRSIRQAGSDVSAAFSSMQEGRGQTRGKKRRHPTPIPQAPPPLMVDSAGTRDAPVAAAEQSDPRREDTQRGVGRAGAGRGRPVTPPPPPVMKNQPGPEARGNVLISQPPIVVDSREGAAKPGQAGSSTRRAVPPPIPVDARSARRTPPAGTRRATPRHGTVRRQPSKTVRREDSSADIMDQNLISEKSLDEVILAYLSEDSKDE